MASRSARTVLLDAFTNRTIERIPISPFIHVNHVKELYHSQDVDCVEKTPEVYARYGFDLIHRNCSIPYEAYGPEGPEWKMDVRTTTHGRDTSTATSIRTPGGSLLVREDVRWVYEYDAESSVTTFPVRSRADLELFRRYLPPVSRVDTSDIQRAKKAVGDDGIVAPWIQGAFNVAAIYYRKVDELLLDPLTDPAFYGEMMAFFLGRYKTYLQRLIDAGVDALSYGGNVANGKVVSRKFFRAHILPYERDLIDFIQRQGVTVLYHNCGYARNLIPVYPELGMRAYESLTPPPYGDTILEEAVRTLGSRTTLLGGIDQLDLLRTGTSNEIASEVKRVLDTVRGRCTFVLGTTDYFNENTPQDKIRLLADVGHRYGRL